MVHVAASFVLSFVFFFSKFFLYFLARSDVNGIGQIRMKISLMSNKKREEGKERIFNWSRSTILILSVFLVQLTLDAFNSYYNQLRFSAYVTSTCFQRTKATGVAAPDISFVFTSLSGISHFFFFPIFCRAIQAFSPVLPFFSTVCNGSSSPSAARMPILRLHYIHPLNKTGATSVCVSSYVNV